MEDGAVAEEKLNGPQIVLTEEQNRVLSEAMSSVVVRDPSGRIVCEIDPQPSPAFIAEMKRRARSEGPRFTNTQVQALLAALQRESERTGELNETQLLAFVEPWRRAESA